MFNLNENYVSRLIKVSYGENLSVIMERLRIEKACSLLINTNDKSEDIAELVGYSSESSFRRAFKKIMGMTPVEYRKSVRV